MTLLPAFHEVRFPPAVGFGSSGGPQWRTDIVALGSGAEARNSRWAQSRRRYDAGYGIRTLDALQEVAAFFEERRGRLFGFRFRDPLDWKSCAASAEPSASDVELGTGDGTQTQFQLIKKTGLGATAHERVIAKPVAGSVAVAVGGVAKLVGSEVTLDETNGVLTFQPGHVPGIAQSVTAGFEFDVPVRFDSDRLDINLSHFKAGDIPQIPILEIRT